MNELVFGPPPEWPGDESQYRQIVEEHLQATKERERDPDALPSWFTAITLTHCHNRMR